MRKIRKVYWNYGKTVINLYTTTKKQETLQIKVSCSQQKSARRDSNPRPRPWQGRAPPTEPLAHIWNCIVAFKERETGLEPAAPTLARSCSTNWATRAYVNCFVSVCQTHLISYYGKSNLSTIFWKNLTEKFNRNFGYRNRNVSADLRRKKRKTEWKRYFLGVELINEECYNKGHGKMVTEI